MDRRRFLGGVAFGFIVAPPAVHAQAKVPRLGFLTVLPFESTETQALLDAFRQGLRERGYMEGQNIAIEYRSAGGRIEQVAGLASELALLKVDVIVTGTSPLARFVQQATTTIPIVAAVMGDPVEEGLATSLARPGGNVTGLTYLGPELVFKRLELLKQILPAVSRIAALWSRDAFGERMMKDVLSEADVEARKMGVQLQLVEVRRPGEIEAAFSEIVRGQAEALLVLPSVMLYVEQKRIVELAAKHRLPSIYFLKESVVNGGLISYGPSSVDVYRRAAIYVDKILKGAKPGDLPIEQPTKFELMLNLKTAKALGLTIPQLVLLRADEVIQ
jgi:putative tryptophan/tyrosine transport system substrate-binding protein